MADFKVDPADPSFAFTDDSRKIRIPVAQAQALASRTGGTVHPAELSAETIAGQATDAADTSTAGALVEDGGSSGAFSDIDIHGPPSHLPGTGPDAEGEQASGPVPTGGVSLGALRQPQGGQAPRPAPRRVVTVQGPTQTQRRLAGPGEVEGAVAIEQGQQSLLEVAEERAQRRAAANIEAAQVAQQQAQIANDAIVQEQERQQRRQRAVQTEMAKLGAMREELMGAEVDPQRFWARTDTGTRIINAVAAGLGALSNALVGGGNPALAQIEAALDRDLEAQRKGLDLKVQGARFQESVLAHTRQQFADEDQAVQAARILQLDALDAQLAEIQARAASDDAQLMIKELRGQAQTAKGQRAQELGQSLSATVVEQQKQVVVGGGRRGADGLGPGDNIPGTVVTDSEGFNKLPAKDKGSIRDFSGEANAVLKTLDRMIALREEHGFEVLNRDVVAEGNEMRESVINGLRVMENTGVPQAHEMARFEDRVPDPTGAGFTTAKLKALRKSIEQRANNILRPRFVQLEGSRAEGSRGARNAARAVVQ